MAIFQEIGDRVGEALVFKNLADLYQKLEKLNLAMDYCQQALSLAKGLGIPLAIECEILQQQLQESLTDE